MNTRLALCCLALSLCACNAAQPPLTSAEVQQFVRDYAAATNSANAPKIMSMVVHDATASSISGGKIDRGWDAIRVSTDAGLEQRKGKIELGAVDVTPLSSEAAVATGTLNVRGIHHVGNMIVDSLPGAFTVVVKRTPEGLRLVHEHYSIRATLASR
jgi:ketosteroid isomerase-like protein